MIATLRSPAPGRLPRILLAAWLCAAAVLVAGPRPAAASTTPCVPSVPPAAPTVEPTSVLWQRTINVGSVARTYYVYRPTRVVLCPAPLVLVLHGINTTALQMAAATLFTVEAEQQGFIVIFPESAAPDYSWNVGYAGCCGLAANSNIDDQGFIRALVKQAEADYLVDPQRIFATGHSNGGFLSYGLACMQASTFAAIGPVGAYPDPWCAPSRPVAVIHIHGSADPIVPYSFFVPWGMSKWRQFDHCGGADTSATSGGVVHTVYGASCDSGTGVELYLVEGMGHTWPAPWTLGDAGAQQLNGTDTIWQFFATHYRYALAGIDPRGAMLAIRL